ncbi:MAG TPA: GAF and ANTAR domain-containing protein [Actinomycetes bacterium]|nr:GAF and ANTAR domain-containing protein [Actinomycetes bacterium]
MHPGSREPTAGTPPPAEADLGGGLEPAVQRVVAAGVSLLGADGAALMVLDEDGELLRTVAAGRLAPMLESARDQLWAGPCLEAVARGALVQTPALSFEHRWSKLALVAAEHAVHGLISVPVDPGGGCVGTFTVVRTPARPWVPAEISAVETFAEVVATLTRTVTEVAVRAEVVGQLEHALRHRVVIEQAKGRLMEREGLSPAEAFDRLRRSARTSRRKVSEVALDVLAGRPLKDPPPRP